MYNSNINAAITEDIPHHLHKKTTEYEKNIYTMPCIKNYMPKSIETNLQNITDFTIAKNRYISQHKITKIANYDMAKIEDFLNASTTLAKNIEISNKYLIDGYFGNISTGILKNDNTNSVQKIAIKTFKQADEIPKDYRVVSVDISFFHEVNSLLTLRNQDNIVRIIGAIKNTTVGIYSLILELADISLANYNDKFVSKQTNISLTNDNLACIIKEVLSAVRACMSFNIHHLDIHCGNLLIFFQQQKIKLSDFGMLATDYNDTSFLNMKSQILYCICECVIANSQHHPILNEELTSIKAKVIQQLQTNNQPLDEETILYQFQIEYANKILLYAENKQFLEYFLCFKYFHDIIAITNLEEIIRLIEDRFNCEFPMEPFENVNPVTKSY